MTECHDGVTASGVEWCYAHNREPILCYLQEVQETNKAQEKKDKKSGLRK